jgi:hypothetical protein
MAAQDASTAARVARSGMELLQPQQGLAALEGLLGASSAARPSSSSPVVSIVPFVWDRFLQRYKGHVPSFFLEVGANAAPQIGQPQARTGSAKGAVGVKRTTALKQQVEETIQSILGHEVSYENVLQGCTPDASGKVPEYAAPFEKPLHGCIRLIMKWTVNHIVCLTYIHNACINCTFT